MGWGLPVQSLSGSSIELFGTAIQLSLADSRKIHPFREVLSK